MSNSTTNITHPGHFIKKEVIPKGVSVTAAARALGVGRPALSNLLNGKSALSPEMAAKIEKAFGHNAQELLALQNAFEAKSNIPDVLATASLPYIPPFLKATANDISNWSQRIASRTRFAIFLRMLVHSTCSSTSLVDFPGNDDGERPGWDGEIECETGNPWVPAGKSGWEFGTNADYYSKANKDYKKSVKGVDAEIRKGMVFVFVTPHRWKSKSKWEAEKRAEGNWKDVRVYDASDLEQWLEQSLPAQTWFANETGVEHEGTLSLDRCWVKWNADCEPSFVEEVFEEAISTTGKKLAERIRGDDGRVVRLAADSVEEGLAFLHALFNHSAGGLAQQRDRIIAFTKPGPLSRLAAKTSRFIPIITNREVEKELSETGQKLGGIVITPRTTEGVEKDVVLEPLSGEAFRVGLEKMELSRDAISKLSNESGRSLTVLRRRLSTSDAIRKPEWSNQSDLAKFLFPILLAGAWNSRNKTDCIVLCELAGIDDYRDLEDHFSKLLSLNSPPVWAVGAFRGVVSKIDALYAICNWINEDELRRFFSVADLVLSERDPSLDLPEEDRWAAHIYDKRREISGSLRDGISDSLALMSMHGKELFFSRTGVNTEHLCSNLVRDLLVPLNDDLLESQASDLPIYAEAAPDTFLKILEDDLDSDEPVVFSLIRPAGTGMFGRNPRTGLLWALENLAWSANYLPRVVNILVRLSEIKLDDNWVNKPVETLRSIFRSWLPQTAASIEQRIALMNRMIAENPDVAWTICKAELDPSPGFASPNHKPRWRDDAFGHGEGATRRERNEFVIFCIESALKWPSYDVDIMCDLIGLEDFVTDEHNEQMWGVVNAWAVTASDEDRAILREKIRTTIRRTMRRKKREGRDADSDARRSKLAKDTYDTLEPRDLIQKFSWLFKKHWVPEAWDEIEDDIDYRKRDERIQSLRDDAAQQVYQERGFQGFIDLAFLGEAAWVVGRCAGRVLIDSNDRRDFVDFAISHRPLANNFAMRQLIGGMFAEIGPSETCGVLHALRVGVDNEVLLELYCLAPFVTETWADVARFDVEFQNMYWKMVLPNWMHHSEQDLQFATSKLLEQGRPTAAFNFIHLDLKSVSSPQLYQVLMDMTTTSEDRGAIQTMEAYSIKEAIKILTERGAHTQSELALLEFRYLAIYRDEKEEALNLEKEVSQNPSIFCDAVEMAFKRDDGTSDKEDIEDLDAVATNAYRLLDALNRIPGTKDDGTVDAHHLEEWITEARRLCENKGRRDIADYRIGELLSNAKLGADGVWPCEGVRSVMDRLMTDSVSRGFYIGTKNARGVHFRGEGGAQERELANKYAGWASSMEYEFPNTATTLRTIAESYTSEAEYEDNEAAIRKRMRY
ncbi:HigA family addiction module antitoxin [Palleronia pelagia]|uniref:Addiction module antidote protein, HigA family n=1 Tax=Palleronia pelagia TaxID=387096 RepID=A0A1H8C4H5_9RHOB|nr:HigA family addiction module antitoxin [Palleronia pelagia]SEM89178.1 addiction module antidote protein, HigA family [Palleronia pelagia]